MERLRSVMSRVYYVVFYFFLCPLYGYLLVLVHVWFSFVFSTT